MSDYILNMPGIVDMFKSNETEVPVSSILYQVEKEMTF